MTIIRPFGCHVFLVEKTPINIIISNRTKPFVFQRFKGLQANESFAGWPGIHQNLGVGFF